MIAILLKINKINLLFLFVILSIKTFGQNNSCNQEVAIKNYSKVIPKEVCIEKNLIISYVYSFYHPIDFNKDSINDLVFVTRKKKRNIGDPKSIHFYQMNHDSSYTFIRKFDNIFPIYFDPNNEAPLLNNKELEDIFNCYIVPDPLYSLEINNDLIKITRRMDGQNFELYNYIFKYNTEIKNWKLEKIENLINNQINPKTSTPNYTLSNFNYCN